FCSNVSIAVPRGAETLVAEAQALSVGIVGLNVVVPAVAESATVDVTLIVGRELMPGRASVAVNSSGWGARMATSASPVKRLPYAVRRRPLAGKARAVDRQRLRAENMGPYVLAAHDLVGVEKTAIIRDALAPAITVTPYAEDLDPLFTVRLSRGHFSLPPIVV